MLTERTVILSFLLPLLCSLTLGPSCRKDARPEEKTGWDTPKEDSAQCRKVSNFNDPLIVDWSPQQRQELEEAMQEGVAVVAYDCKNLRLLKGCKLNGSYAFLAESPKEQNIRFKRADEVVANMPAFGVSMLRDLRSDLNPDSTIDLSMFVIGKHRATIKDASRQRLLGGAACEGATHFVKNALVGAFAIGIGHKDAPSAGIGMFKDRSKDSRLAQASDGDPNSCQQAPADLTKAPINCNTIINIETFTLDTAPIMTTRPPVSEKPKDSASQTHQCKAGDLRDCEAQCSAGHAGSCDALGAMYGSNAGVATDMTRAASLFKLACDGGFTLGCTKLGLLYMNGQGVSQDNSRAITLFEQACDRGNPPGCTYLGLMHERGAGVVTDKSRAASLYKQACDGGEAYGCNNLGMLYRGDQGVMRDTSLALSLFKQSCDSDLLQGCNNLGIMYKNGAGVAQDENRATSLFKQACDGGIAPACNNLAMQYESGLGVAQDKVRAAALYKQVCDSGHPNGCVGLGLLYMTGQGITQDKQHAAALFAQACDGGYGIGCNNLGIMYDAGESVAQDKAHAAALYKQACSLGEPSACSK